MLDEPLAPDTAARRQGVSIPAVAEYAERPCARSRHGTVIVEGAGGLLVRLDTEGGTLLDLAARLAEPARVEVVVVAAAGLGTLNHTELTVAALRARGLEPSGWSSARGRPYPAWPSSATSRTCPGSPASPAGDRARGLGSLNGEEFRRRRRAGSA